MSSKTKIAEKYNIAVDAKKGRAYVGKGIIEGQKVLLVKPQTYMNLSGESIRELVDYFKVDPKEELLVIYDDISLNPGQIRIRKKGSAGGHNGIKNIIAQLGTDTFQRIKVGVGIHTTCQNQNSRSFFFLFYDIFIFCQFQKRLK